MEGLAGPAAGGGTLAEATAMDERDGRIERCKCRAMVLGMAALATLSGCASHGHAHYSYGPGYSHYSAGYCGGAEEGLILLAIYGVVSLVHLCFN